MKKRYWLKGGLLSFLVSLVFSLPSIYYHCDLFSWLGGPSPFDAIYCLKLPEFIGPIFPIFVPGLLLSIPIGFLFHLVGMSGIIPKSIIDIIYLGTPFFLVGLVIGLIYGKKRAR